ncbi:condensation domain-containing protein [Burkholderia alba]|uniref:condensation domain-containing protein n=1 Tax=Burkholderia alba TaxID=2683677 RepID=UPI002B058773|nr:condensation domain-containing protein [Burkholderia alba]
MSVIEVQRRAGAGTDVNEAALAPQTPANDLIAVMRLHVAQRPHHVAVRFLADGEHEVHALSYAALDARARRLAAALRARGGPNDRVLLMLPTGLDYIVSFFACQYAGMIAVPAYPPEARHSAHVERLRRMADDCAARIAVLPDESRPMLDGSPLGDALGDIALLSPDAGDAAQFCVERGDPDAVAFLQYTSGSTSAPKGVMVSHANLCANVDAMSRGMGCRADDRMFSWLPLYHDMGLIGGLLMPVLCGFHVTLISPLHFLERPARWLEGVARERANVTGGPDFAFRLCADRVRDAQLDGLDLSSLRVAFCGSEPIRQTTLDAFGARFAPHGFAPASIFPCYGLAEATLYVTGVEVSAGAPETRFAVAALAGAEPVAVRAAGDESKAVVACGAAPSQHAFAIVDPGSRERLADGRVGEIWCSGPSIAGGYWRNPEASAAVFLADAPGFPGRWLRTGDLGFADAGRLFVCGRRKDMIVLRGENVYPQDLEAVLADRVEWLRRGRIAAFPVETADGSEGIGIAAEVPRGKARRIEPAEIFAAIADALGEAFQYETALILLLEPGDLPRTSSGKLQRSACVSAWRDGTVVPFAVREAGIPAAGIPAEGGRDAAAEAGGAPATPTEQAVAEIWRDVLDIAPPSSADDFFALGGRSLLALKVASRLRAQFERDVPLGLLFSHPTLRGLAAALDAWWAQPARAAARQPALTRRGLREAPLSLPQERLWVLWRVDPDSAAYNVSGALELDGPFDAAAAQRALDQLVRRHDMLRTRFADIDDAPRQVILPAERAADAWHWETVTLRDAAPGELAAQLRARARAPFDLMQGPLFRATLFARAPQRHLLHFVMHHIVSDGWSINVLLREFAAGYRAARRGEAPVLPALPVQYGDYAAWQRERFSGTGQAALDAQLGYWRERLDGLDGPLDLPTEHDRATPYDPLAARVGIRIPAPLAARLDALARTGHATLFMVLLAALDALLYRYSGAQDVVVAVPVAGRDRLETEGLIGFFVNTLAMRAQVKGTQSFAALLGQVRADSIDAQANSDVPFERVVAELPLERRGAGHSLAQIKFVLHDEFDTALDLDGARCALVDADASDARFELALDVLRRGADGLDCVFMYARALYDDAFVAQFARHYVDLLEQIVADPERAIGAYGLQDYDEETTDGLSVAGVDAY